MTRLRQKRPRLRLDPESYEQLRLQVLERDGWRCQHCGSLADLQPHHIEPRSQLGNDTEENLITLCANCHQFLHLHREGHWFAELPSYGARGKRKS